MRVKWINSGLVALLCGYAATASALPTIDDDISGDQALNTGSVISGNFTFDPSIVTGASLQAIHLQFTFADDHDDATTNLETLAFNTTDTQTHNGVRTSNAITTYHYYLDDTEAEQVQISSLGQTATGESAIGSYEALGKVTVDGPFPVADSLCNNTQGVFSSCENIYTTEIKNFVGGKTGSFTVTLTITDPATIASVTSTGAIPFQISSLAGDFAFNTGVAKFETTPTAITAIEKFYPVRVDGISSIRGLNDNGEVVGQYGGATSDGYVHAGYWRFGEVTDLGMIGCRDSVTFCYSQAADINNDGQIVGESNLSESWPSAYFWPWAMAYVHDTIWENKDASPTTFASIGHEYTHPTDISEQGDIVGWGRSMDWNAFSGDRLVHGYVKSGQDVYEIGTYGHYSKAFSVNESLQATGEIDVYGDKHAFFWDDEQVNVLNHLGGSSSVGNDINNGDEPIVVGGSTLADGTAVPAMWQYGTAKELPLLAGATSGGAKAINDEGVIVGSVNGQAVIWQNGSVATLDSLVDSGLGLQFTGVVDLSESGHVLATATDGNTYLLVPQRVGEVSGSTVCAMGCDYTSIQTAIDAATAGQTIYVAHGLYNEVITVDGINLVSLHGSENTVIDTAGLVGAAVTISNATISGFTIRGGEGGVIANDNSVISDNHITGNASQGNGGGVVIAGTNVLVTGNSITANSAVNGGGVAFASSAQGVVSDNTIDGNSATLGGGIYTAAQAQHQLSENKVTNNSAEQGGGIYLSTGDTSTTLTNSLIAHNHATVSGGGLAVYSTVADIANLTVVDNSSDDSAGGIISSSATVNNTISWNNTSPVTPDAALMAYSISNGQTATGTNSDVDPQFIDYPNGDYRIAAGSPAIDSGMQSGVTTDLLGIARPYDGDGQGSGATGDGSDFDIGAYEYTPDSTQSLSAVKKLKLNDDVLVQEGNQVSLGIAQGGDNVASYQWTQVSGPTVTLSSANTASPSFTSPTVSTVTTLAFEVVVTYQDGSVQTKRIYVSVAPVNIGPVAEAGEDFIVVSQQTGVLSGSGTDSDGSIASYSWIQESGEAATITNANSAVASFVAPVTSSVITLSFRLSVTDDEGVVRSDTVKVTVYPPNTAPEAEPLHVSTTKDVALSNLLDASDYNADPLTYQLMSQPALGTVQLIDPATGEFSYQPNAGSVGTDSFTYIANDGELDSQVATVTIEIVDPTLLPVGTAVDQVFQQSWMLEGELGAGIAKVLFDDRGNRYVVGGFGGGYGDVDLDVTESGVDDRYFGTHGARMMLSRVNAAGEYVWSKVVGDGMSVLDAAQDKNGNIYIAGFFSLTTDFDPGVGVVERTPFHTDAVVVKYDRDGNFLDVWMWGAQGAYNYAQSVDVDAAGNVYIGGEFNESVVDLDPTTGTDNSDTPPYASSLGFLIKMDNAGSYVWGNSFAGSESRVAVAPSGDIYRSGQNIISKYDTNGTELWSQRFEGSAEIWGISLEGSDNLYVAGGYRYGMDLDPGAGVFQVASAGSTDIFVVKLDQAAGDFVWGRNISSSAWEIAFTVHADGRGNVYLGGAYSGGGNDITVDFDWGAGEDLKQGWWETFFLTHITSDGQYVSTFVGGGNAQVAPSDEIRDIGSDALGNLYVSGLYQQGTVDFDPGAGVHARAPRGDSDGFTIVMTPSGSTVDSDGDGYYDHQDKFVNDPNEWLDTDSDLIGNNADLDDDNDGLSDEYEVNNGLDPLFPDAQFDKDGDGYSNQEEQALGLDPSLADTDGDGVIDGDDYYPHDPLESANFDGDLLGDNADLDDDNDGMPDAWELVYGFNPYDVSDAALDTNGDGFTNLQEYQNGTNPLENMPIYTAINWVDQVNVSASGDVLIQTGGYVWGGAVSDVGFDGDGGVDYQATGAEYYNRAFGLSETNDSASVNDIEYAFSISQRYSYWAASLRIFENGVPVSGVNLGSYVYGEKLSIYRQGDTIYYARNDQVVYTSARHTTAALMVDTALYNGTQFSGMQMYARAYLTDLDGDGVFDPYDAFPNDPTEWFDTDNDGVGNNTDLDDDGDQMPDEWEIYYGLDPLVDDGQDDLDGDGTSNQDEYLNGYDPSRANVAVQLVDWSDFYYTEVNGDSLGRTSGWSGPAGAASASRIAGDGGLEYVIANSGYFRTIGLSASNDSPALSDMDYAFSFYKVSRPDRYLVTIVENGVYSGWYIGYRAGDRISITREGGNVLYTYNGNVVRTVADHTAGVDLLVDATIDSWGTFTGVKMLTSLPQGLVVSKAADTNDGVCDSDCSLREAVITANATPGEDTIILPAGEYQLTLSGDEDASVGGDLDVSDDLVINGDGVDTTTINGMGLYRLFDVGDNGAVPISLTLRDMTLRNATDENETSHFGSGVAFFNGGTLTVENTQFVNNKGSFYGASIQLRSDTALVEPTLVVKNSRFTGNCAQSGAAIDGEGAWTIEDSTFSNNGGTFTPDQGSSYPCDVIYGGAALYMQNADVTIRRSAFIGNEGSAGGAIYANQGSLTLINSTLANNVANGSGYVDGGGAIKTWGATVSLRNSTLAYNSAVGSGGAIDIGSASSATMVNTIMANNSSLGGDCSGAITSQGYNLVGDMTGCTYQVGIGEVSGDPGLDTMVDGGAPGLVYFPLLPNPGGVASPVIDAGSNADCEVLDQTGTARPLDGNSDGTAVCDIGAYEY